ncbi:nodulation protein NodH [Roseinatronobacter alkalisoli]|uniref:Nodulation protein NodH n=1 Tax=Roseinatronobacter alkalisoli TaxID=3028235 RepID=A0ABT5T5T4_9RHOB|nr:nodulation protein NodH [Roseinatronobacter sp. HJB301]MDD7970465.1 nodulation protein NodH [Roseinatronobacter sp. HJB301]
MTTVKGFTYFVLLAEMRTGSNLLEANLNEFDGLTCLGEAFNPAFIGHQGCDELLGVTQKQREENPFPLLEGIRQHDGLAGFRFFHDHDPRILPTIMDDPCCAKIILTRNPLDSYVSLKIAQATQQWKLGDVKTKRSAQVAFDPVEFENHVAQLQAFQLRIQRMLQESGQTAFYIAYDDANDVQVLNGLARWLGIDAQIEKTSGKLKRQNPEPLEQKLSNYDAVRDGMARLDRFNLSRTPGFEPLRGGQIWAYRACRSLPLAYAPLGGGVRDGDILDWMAGIDGAARGDLLHDFSPESWQDWLRTNPGHLSFSVISHPLERAHYVYRNQVLHGARENVRRFLAHVYDVTLPEKGSPMDDYGVDEHCRAFKAFLRFVHANLNGQTSMMTRPAWALQSEQIADIASRGPIRHVLRDDMLRDSLPLLGAGLGRELPPFDPPQKYYRLTLESIYDAEIESLGRAAYGEDYLRLGYVDWAG